MDWTRLELGGRTTAMSGTACAGVADDGTAFIALLEPPEPPARPVDDIVLDSFGVVGLGQGQQTWLTGRGSDGQLHLWSVAPPHDPKVRTDSPIEGRAVWAVPAVHTHGAGALSATFDESGWRLRHQSFDTLADPGGPGLRLGGPPDRWLAHALGDRGQVMIAGLVGRGPEPSAGAWVLTPTANGPSEPGKDWRRVHLSPAPTELSSVVVGADRRTWIAGRVAAGPVVYELLDLPFRGPLRTAAVGMPVLALAPEALDGPGRPVVLVEGARTGLPAFVAATTGGNKLCWLHPSGWRAHAVPDGRLGSACLAGGRIHVLVDHAVWSLPDPTGD